MSGGRRQRGRGADKEGPERGSGDRAALRPEAEEAEEQEEDYRPKEPRCHASLPLT